MRVLKCLVLGLRLRSPEHVVADRELGGVGNRVSWRWKHTSIVGIGSTALKVPIHFTFRCHLDTLTTDDICLTVGGIESECGVIRAEGRYSGRARHTTSLLGHSLVHVRGATSASSHMDSLLDL